MNHGKAHTVRYFPFRGAENTPPDPGGKGGRQVSEPEPYLDDVTRSERIRQICASKYLYGYPDFKVIDPIKENYPACTMPLAATSPTVVTPEILSNTQYVHDYVTHVALIREMLGQASLSVNPAVLERCSNKLLQSLGGLLTGASNCQHTRDSWHGTYSRMERREGGAN